MEENYNSDLSTENQNNYYEERPKKSVTVYILAFLLVAIIFSIGFYVLNSGFKFGKSSDEKYDALRKRICEAAEEYVTSDSTIKLDVEKSMVIKYQKLSDANLIEARIANPYYSGGLFNKSDEEKYYSMNNSVRITKQMDGTYMCDLVNNSSDTTAPELRLSGDEDIALVVGTEFQDPGYMATDDYDGDITDRVVRSGNVDINTAGEYTLTYSVQDSAGNVTTKTRKFIYKELSNVEFTLGSITDNVKPMIQLKGENPYCLVKGTKYVEPGAIAVDNVDGNITELIAITNKVTGNLIGTFKVVYQVEDSAGNKTTSYRTVVVSTSCDSSNVEATDNIEVDEGEEKVLSLADLIGVESVNAAKTKGKTAINRAPTLTLIGKNSIIIKQGTQYIDLGATAYDKEDGDITNKIITDQTEVNVNTPGVYKVRYRVSDNGVNGKNVKQAIITRTVAVVSSGATKASVKFTEDKSNVTVDLGKGNNSLIAAPKAVNEKGAAVTVKTKIENYVTKEVVNEINWNQIGQYRVTYTATHSSGLIRQTKSIVVSVVSGTVTIGGKTDIEIALRSENCDISEIDLLKGGVVFTAAGSPTISLEDNKGKACSVGKYKVMVTATTSDKKETKREITVNVVQKESEVATDEPNIVEVTSNSANTKDPYNTNRSYVGGTVSGIKIAFKTAPVDGVETAYFEYSENCNSVSGKIPISKANEGIYNWTKEGENAICIRAVSTDKVPGEWSDPIYLYLDLTGPKAEFTHEWADGSDDWHNTALTLTYTAVDEGSGLDHFEYTYDDVRAKKASDIKTYYEATGELMVNENTEPSRPMLFVFVRAVDKVGNKGEWTLKPAYANIDTIAPNAPTLSVEKNETRYATVVAAYKDASSVRPSGANGVIYKINDEDEQTSDVLSNAENLSKAVKCDSNKMSDSELSKCLKTNALMEKSYKIELPLNTTSSNIKYNVEAWSVDKAGNRSSTSSRISATRAPGVEVKSVLLKNGDTEIKEASDCQLEELYVGGRLKLTATPVPADADEQDVKWLSSNPEIATVDYNGNIVARSVGTTAIEAMIGSESRVCSLTVSEKHISCNPGEYLPAGQIICEECKANNYCPGLNNVVIDTEEDQGISKCDDGYSNLKGASKCTPKKLTIIIDKDIDEKGEIEQTFTYNKEEKINTSKISKWTKDGFKLVGLSTLSSVDEIEYELDETITNDFIDEICDKPECTLNLHAVWLESEEENDDTTENESSETSFYIPSSVKNDDAIINVLNNSELAVVEQGTGGGGTSKTCKVANCSKCSSSNYCSRCNSGYSLSSGKCVRSFVTSCRSGYIKVNGKCKICPAGTYSSGGSATRCTICPAGTYSTGGSSRCNPCAAGTYSLRAGAPSCTRCPSGSYSKAGATHCTSCPAGQIPISGKCVSCDAGTYAKVGALKCTACPAGTISKIGAVSCAACPAGTYSNGNGTKCTKCPIGYTSDARASVCYMNVKAGYYVSTPKAMIAVACPEGTTSVATKVVYGSTSSCSKCPAGTYYTSGKCVACPAGYTSYSGAKSKTQCFISIPAGSYRTSSGTIAKCDGGTYSGSTKYYYGSSNTGSCKKCSAGNYSQAGATSCTKCPDGTISKSGASSCTKCPSGASDVANLYCSKCSAGAYMDENGRCYPCPEGTTSKAGATSCTKCPAGTYTGGWRKCMKCPAGTYSDKTGTASYCETCPKGTYSSSGATSCTKCPTGKTTKAAGAKSKSACK